MISSASILIPSLLFKELMFKSILTSSVFLESIILGLIESSPPVSSNIKLMALFIAFLVNDGSTPLSNLKLASV